MRTQMATLVDRRPGTIERRCHQKVLARIRARTSRRRGLLSFTDCQGRRSAGQTDEMPPALTMTFDRSRRAFNDGVTGSRSLRVGRGAGDHLVARKERRKSAAPAAYVGGY